MNKWMKFMFLIGAESLLKILLCRGMFIKYVLTTMVFYI